MHVTHAFREYRLSDSYSRLRNIGNSLRTRKSTPPKFELGAILLILTTIIKVIMGRRFLDKVIYRLRIYIKASKAVLAIIEAIKVAKKTIYKI